MTRSVSATEAKAKLGDLMKWAVKTGDDVIIQSRGYPQVVIVPFKEYEEMQQLKERARRAAAIARLQALAREVQAQNEGITLDEADAIADEITRTAIDQLVAKGMVKFERDDES
jgi:prevent-host-death family protein